MKLNLGFSLLLSAALFFSAFPIPTARSEKIKDSRSPALVSQKISLIGKEHVSVPECVSDKDCPDWESCSANGTCNMRWGPPARSGSPQSSVAPGEGGIPLEKNKEIVAAFYDLALNQHQPQAAADEFIGNRYIQHNPNISDGKEAFVEFIKSRVILFPNLHAEIKNIWADRDRVIIHVYSKNDNDDRGRAIVDIFRLSEGKIVEHWDVIQKIPELSNNSNGMF